MEQKKISWKLLAFMAFSTVWGFGNVVNGFVWFNGIQVIFSWIFMFALYFVPYALMVGELGSAFKNAGGGVSSWIRETMGTKIAYYAGWTYWACHITYIASKGSGGLDELQDKVGRLLDKFNALPLDKTLGELNGSLNQLKQTLASANRLLGQNSTQKMPAELNATLQELRKTLQGVSPESPMYQDIQQTLAALNRTLQDVQPLVRTLNEKPNALIFNQNGKDPIPRGK